MNREWFFWIWINNILQLKPLSNHSKKVLFWNGNQLMLQDENFYEGISLKVIHIRILRFITINAALFWLLNSTFIWRLLKDIPNYVLNCKFNAELKEKSKNRSYAHSKKLSELNTYCGVKNQNLKGIGDFFIDIP